MEKLGDIAPTFIILGNHDFRQDQPNCPDIITSLGGQTNNDIQNQKNNI